MDIFFIRKRGFYIQYNKNDAKGFECETNLGQSH